jgi:hypothetical protein
MQHKFTLTKTALQPPVVEQAKSIAHANLSNDHIIELPANKKLPDMRGASYLKLTIY